MKKAKKAKKRVTAKPSRKVKTVGADGLCACVPFAGAPGGMLVSDGFNWKKLAPPTVTDPPPTLKYGDNGPFWASA